MVGCDTVTVWDAVLKAAKPGALALTVVVPPPSDRTPLPLSPR